MKQTKTRKTQYVLKQIAHMENDFTGKFGIPRQSGLASSVKSRIVFEPEYRNPDALKGLEEFSHIWLIWQFSESVREDFSPTVRPPKLGGNERKGVFATRSPFRPNALGLSSVKLEEILRDDPDGPVLLVSGADLMNGTPIYDIKPYIPYADIHADASEGFTAYTDQKTLKVRFETEFPDTFPEEKKQALQEILSQDPRPAYQRDPERIYGCSYAGYEVRFRVREEVLTVVQVTK